MTDKAAGTDFRQSGNPENAKDADRAWMSVREMGGLLGIRKTDRCWLVHKNVFETRTIQGKMWVNLESFEKWYANQVKYQKVTREEPGLELKASSFSPRDISQLLEIPEYRVYDLIKEKKWEIVTVDHWTRVKRDSFEKWYRGQKHYRTAEDRQNDEDLENATIIFAGPSGGGKTTLCHLIARFWDVNQGTVSLDGKNVREYSMNSLMENFSFVFQNVYLFHDTVANNIRFGRPDASMDEVMNAAKKACCHDFIMALPEGYDTIIGENGASLSGGEKQRISIARAIMKDAPVIILDEATANVDPENEKELMAAIEALTSEKTILMIAHRLKTVRRADQNFVIDKGRIAQQGTHEELIRREGIYRNFVSERKKAVSWKL